MSLNILVRCHFVGHFVIDERIWKNFGHFFGKLGMKRLEKYSILAIFLFDFSVFFGWSFSPKTEKDLKTEKTEKTFSVGTFIPEWRVLSSKLLFV